MAADIGGTETMQVDVIDRYDDFVALRSHWDEAYAADPDANYFLSWTFMSTWLGKTETAEKRNAEGWFVLAGRSTRHENRHVAFLPLSLRRRRSPQGVDYTELVMGGRKYADYTGMVSWPEHRHAAISAFLRQISSLTWSRWRLECLRLPDGELPRWLIPFSSPNYAIHRTVSVNTGETTDQDTCPFIPLPSDWNDYLATRLSANTRQKLRRLLRQIEGPDEFSISHASADTVERDIKALLYFWRSKWSDKKGPKLDSMTSLIGTMLMRSYRAGTLFLPVLRYRGRPVAAHGCFFDRQKKALLFMIAGRDQKFEGPSPGLVLHAHSLRWAIAQSCTTYDFLRGNEPYKYTFGAVERRLDSLIVVRRRHPTTPLATNSN